MYLDHKIYLDLYILHHAKLFEKENINIIRYFFIAN